MKKLLILSAIVAVASTAAFAETEVKGKFFYNHPVVKHDNSDKKLDWTKSKAEIYIVADDFKVELDVPVAHERGKDDITVDQAYGWFEVGPGKVKVGVMETSIGGEPYYGHASHSSWKEIEGFGFAYFQKMDDMTLMFGNVGSLLADETNSVADRTLFAGVNMAVPGLKKPMLKQRLPMFPLRTRAMQRPCCRLNINQK